MVWDLATGRIRNVLAGHRGWSACVTCAEGRGLWPLALTGGHDNRVNVWGRATGTAPPLPHRLAVDFPRPARRGPSVRRCAPCRSTEAGCLTLVATSDGMVRALESRGLPFGARRAGTVPAMR